MSMKNLIITVLLSIGAYQAYQKMNVSKPFLSTTNADLVLFTSSVCNAPCTDARSVIRETGLSVEEVLVGGDDNDSLLRFKAAGGGDQVPLLLTKTGKVFGFNRIEYLSAMADSNGLYVLPDDAQDVLGSHFENGEPKLVMYGTKWCPYCKKAREYFLSHGLDYEERDVEESREYKVMYKWLDTGGYPLVYYGAKRQEGFNASKLNALLDS